MTAARRHADGAAVLLRSSQPVGKTIVGGNVIKLSGRLVVPGTPRLSAVHSHDCALIAAERHSLRIVGIDPELMIIVATGRSFNRRPLLAAVRRSVNGRVRDVNDVRILRIS